MSIDNLNQKLNGELPVTSEELLVLVKSWGKIDSNNGDIENIGSCYDLSRLDVSQITDMSNLFQNSPFDGDIGNWDTSNVTNMCFMFIGAEKFNQDISSWNICNVTSLESMFFNAESFNQPIGIWNTSNVTNMSEMFSYAYDFNQELKFDTSNVTDMSAMFGMAYSFNQPLNFDTSNVISMEYMFTEARVFNQTINFDISNVISMKEMFSFAEAFLDRYNNGKELPYYTNEIKDWIYNHKNRMNDLNIKDQHGKEINDFFSKFSNKEFSKEI